MIFVIIGILFLSIGAQWFVFGSKQISLALGISPLILGLTVVAFGTSAPEIFLSALAARKEEGAIVIGNLLGSNLFNSLCSLGIAALISPIVVHKKAIYEEVPFNFLATLLFWGLAATHFLNLWGGALLIICYFLYVAFLYRQSVSEKTAPSIEKKTSFLRMFFSLIGGIIFLIFGSELLINGVQAIADSYNLPPLIISLLLVAIGTSLPEFAVTIHCLIKKEGEMALGNLLGSNLLNLLLAGGVAAIASPNTLAVPESSLFFDLPIVCGSAIALIPIVFTEHKISRWEGALLLFYYFLYLIFLGLRAIQSPWHPYFLQAFLFFILPMTLCALTVSLVRHYRHPV